MKKSKWLCCVVSVVAFIFVGSVFAGAADKTIRLSSTFPKGHLLIDASEKFKDIVEKGSQGKIKVEIKPSAGSEKDVDVWCSQGKVEMQVTGGQPLQVSAPQYFFFNAPYVMKDFDHFMRVWNGPLGKKAREEVAKKGSQIYLGIVNRGMRQTTSKKALKTAADVQGLKLRLPEVPTWIAVWKQIGADTVPIPLPDLYKALKEGKVEASEGDLTQIDSLKLNEVQSYLTMTNHLAQTGGMLINKPFFDKLSKPEQELVVKASKEACDFANAKMKAGEGKILEGLKAKGMTVVIPDAESFRAKAKPAVEKLFKTEWPVTTWAEVLKQ
jgi:tripartite ATP-independent transporter DctP family solute receptor